MRVRQDCEHCVSGYSPSEKRLNVVLMFVSCQLESWRASELARNDDEAEGGSDYDGRGRGR